MSSIAVNGDYRRGKTALFLLACGWAGMAPHSLSPFKSLLPAIALALWLGGYGLKTVLSDRRKWLSNQHSMKLNQFNSQEWPLVDILIAAKDEELVVERLVQRLISLKYEQDKLKIWIIDDGSQDNTPNLLKDLQVRFTNLNIINRPRSSGGGKSGALNEALGQINGDWILILDADAELAEDSLQRLVLFAEEGGWSAVQLRKSIVNSQNNLLTLLQSMEMAMDAVIQQGRLMNNGAVELRGNGQLIDRKILQKCGGFNESTVTDDLDLSFNLLTSNALIGIMWNPPVLEEGVQTLFALWKQRMRWAEGGLQRFFDYWHLLISNKLSVTLRHDLTCFFLLQYVLPVVSISDLFFAFITKTMPAYWPLSIVAFSISGFAYWRACKTSSDGPKLPSPKPITLLIAIIYLGHWFIVIPWITLKMAILPKKLVWVKTVHHG